MESAKRMRKRGILVRGGGVMCGIVLVAMLVFMARPAGAINFELMGKQGTLMGYANQGMQFGIAGNSFDTHSGFQSAVFQLLLEVQLNLDPDLRFFGSVGCNADWAYPILSDNDDWEDKRFDKSRDEKFIYSHRRDILHEFHFTWTPGSWFFRVGKQIVVWGETDNTRLMDQINPVDQRRGITDVEFETTILPIWLVRTEYYFQPDSSWLQDLGLEFIFNPNADFREDEVITPGNDVAGIWAPNVKIPLPPLPIFPNRYMHLGSLDSFIDRPDSFDDDGFEYGFRVKAVINDTIVTLNAFYGRENSPITINDTSRAPRLERSAEDGRVVLHPPMRGHHALIRFAGFTVTRDFENLYISALGGVAPVFRLEALYAWENTFSADGGTRFKKYDEVRWALGIDWKIWWRLINERAAFMISPQFIHRKILNAPSKGLTSTTGPVRDDNYQTTLMMNTSYFHNKFVPMFVWVRDIRERSNMFIMQATYERSDKWNYTLGTVLYNGEKSEAAFDALTNKDHVFFTVGFRF
jgi:hypothetical protein